MTLELSVVVPLFNEKESIAMMLGSIEQALAGVKHEVVLVDDGSTDGTPEEVNRLVVGKKQVRLVRFRRNFGQTSAMAAGIEAARGEYIATLDGDLQNDPADIPLMLQKLKEENLDIVAGRRANRQDGLYLRKIPSRIANWLIRKISKVTVRDYGCTLKVFKADLAKRLDLYGELHRFIPILACMEGAEIAEMDVRHHARRFGVSKYGLSRTLRVVSDLLLMFFFLKYRQKPMHLFGALGVLSLGAGGLIEAYLLSLKVMGEDIGGRPLFYIGILLLIAGVQLITTGFIAELLMRTYYGAIGRRPYTIRSMYEGGKQVSLPEEEK